MSHFRFIRPLSTNPLQSLPFHSTPFHSRTDSLLETTAHRPRRQVASRRTVHPADSFPVNKLFNMRSGSAAGIFILISIIPSVYSEPKLPDCEQIPKVLCCTQRVLDKCMSGCIDYVTEKCPHKLEKYETIDKEQEQQELTTTTRGPRKQVKMSNRVIGQVDHEAKEKFIDSKDIRRAPMSGDAKMLNLEYPITEVTDADLSSECGTEKSQPPFSPCLSRKSADDVFLSCCRQMVPGNCHSLCTYEHLSMVICACEGYVFYLI
uniref:Domain of unknown function DB domain-containing protein n=1 Tax=Caenorhabditis japonica TaxID=281687 RepID=A0A8R1IJD2_CAEJA